MKIIADFVTNSSEADYCDCDDCSNCNCFCRECVCSQCRYLANTQNREICFTDKRLFFPNGQEGTILYEQWLKDLKRCQI